MTDVLNRSGSGGALRRSDPERWRLNWPHYVNAGLGGWLFLSAFLWAHSSESRLNAAIVGALVALFSAVALMARRVGKLRWVNVALSSWLLISTIFIGRMRTWTNLNAMTVGILILMVALDSLANERGSTMGEALFFPEIPPR
jgi:hypothetical protein